ncbi:MAG: PolC-type DNA polymerase III [Clostridia bacterium]|nr:PolC-type DNA polymerase III [Clostridia bacterium]
MISERITLSDIFSRATGDDDVTSGLVRDISANRTARTFDICVSFPKIVGAEKIDAYRKEVETCYNAARVSFNVTYDIDSPTDEEVLSALLNSVYSVRKTDALYDVIMNSCKCRVVGNRAEIELMHGNRSLLEESHVDEKIADIMLKTLGLVMEVSFVDGELDIEETVLTPIAPPAKKAAKPYSGGALFGRVFDTSSQVEIASITEETGKCVIAGKPFGVASRVLKNNTTLVTFYITDFTSSVTVKCFLKGKDANLLTEALKSADEKGSAVAVRGVAEFDNYSNELVVRTFAIIPFSMPLRTDDSPVKRVELHAHTKSSAMDAVVTAKELVETAVRWGHTAVAITDHGVVQAFPEAFKTKSLLESEIKIIYGVEGYLVDDDKPLRDAVRYHIIILAKNQTGLFNLYKLISASHIDYFYKKPLLPRREINAHREGLIIGSACESGELFRAVLANESDEHLRSIADFYDYLEIQPIGNNEYLQRSGAVADIESLRNLNRRIAALGDAMGKMTVATCDVHFLEARDEIYRRILQAGQGYTDVEFQAPLFFRTTDEMLAEFAYLGEEKAYEVCVENTNRIADMIDDLRPVPKGQFAPKISGSAEDIEHIARKNACALYGDTLPPIVEQRLDKELKSVIGNNYADLYNIARLLVQHSVSDGYIVGSRGSVGSSLLAFLTGITEVNSLQPHYRCPKCLYSKFFTEGEYESGFDLPDALCPECGTRLIKDGHDIPFETFLGFKGDKQPDIDLNFSGEYQSRAHKYTEELFGEGYVFRAGTVNTVAEKTAYGFVMSYFTERGRRVPNAEVERLKRGCMEVKRTTGQHPGGIIVLPKGHDIHEFTPVQHPANDRESGVITTHFDYHSIDQNLLKLDILGHDDPTMIKMLEDLTGIKAADIPLDDKGVMSLFLSTDALGVTPEEIGSEVGTFAVPEFGTKFVRQMLLDTKPTTFSELVRISGLSHGTDVWTHNAQDLVRSGTCKLRDAICCRDDIMIYLIHKGMDASKAFKIMERVRKGKHLTEEDENSMLELDVPAWYIDSCNKIQYMFPRAHAAAYVTMSFRVAYFKVYYPLAFYSTYYTVRADTFDYEAMACGQDKVKRLIHDISLIDEPSSRDKVTLTILEVVNEMYARGIEFLPIDIYKSHPTRFLCEDGKIRPALNSLPGLGSAAAEGIARARETGEFLSVDEFKTRTGVSSAAIDMFSRNGCFAGMPQSSQINLFEMQ